jgi:hypothetical protein
MEYYLYLRTRPYLADFIKNAYGDPVALERDSPEVRIIRKFLSRTPKGKLPDSGEGSNLIVIIPWFKEIDKRVYNYLSRPAKKTLLESFNQMLEHSMLEEIGKLENYYSGKISTLIYAWMEKHGIPDNETNWYTLSKKYYRLRNRYLKKSNREQEKS